MKQAYPHDHIVFRTLPGLYEMKRM